MSDPAAPSCPPRLVLRDLPLSARVVLAAFMMSVGLGYFSALVNLHFQQATPGQPLPTGEDVVGNYHGRPGVSQMERLLTTPDTAPFNGQGSMWAAFTSQVVGLEAACEARLAKQSTTKPISTLERLLTTPDTEPFNGQGSMRAAFGDSLRGTPSRDDLTEAKAKQLKLDLDKDKEREQAEAAAQKDLDGEAMALVFWVRAAPKRKRTPRTPFR